MSKVPEKSIGAYFFKTVKMARSSPVKHVCNLFFWEQKKKNNSCLVHCVEEKLVPEIMVKKRN